MPRVADRPPARIMLAVGLVASTTLALQVLLTRLFSAALYYHFGFLAISLALLGTGAGAILIYIRRQQFESAAVPRILARWSLALAVLLLVVPALLVRLDYTFSGRVTFDFALNLGAACLLSALPFLAAGIVIALAVQSYTAQIDRVYASDLAGAGLGAIVVVPLLWLVDAPTLVVALGGAAAAAAALFAGTKAPELRPAAVAVLVAAGLVAISAATTLYYLPPAAKVAGNPLAADRWTPLSRVVGYRAPRGSAYALVFYDRVYAPVPVRRGRALPDWRILHLGPQSIGYALTGPGRTLVIGGGGGRDIDNALTSGQRRVDVIELNRGIRRVVDEDLRGESGSPYTLPHVHTTIGDGRSTLAARDTRYDTIHIGFTDTLSANSAQAFALTEANLYTVEAFDEYLDHLRPDGVLNVSRPYHLVGDEALRITVLALAALKRHGIRHPERNVVVILGHDIFNELIGTVLVRKRAFTPAELARVRRLAAERGAGVAFAPGGPYYREWGDLARARSPESFCRSYRLDVCPPTDDKPFFFNMTRLGSVGAATTPGYVYSIDPFAVLLVTLAILAGMSLLAFVLPLALVRGSGRPPPSSLLFFAAIGLGYLELEVALIQRFVLFLGFPTYALSVVLFSLLVFTGLGSLWSGRFARPRRTLIAALAVGIALICASAYGLAPLLRALIDLPFAARIAVTLTLLAPVGLTLGMAMPIGLGRLAGLYPSGVAWAWGINGIASVLATVLAITVAISFGFPVATLVAGACYVVALAHVLVGRWPRSPEPVVVDEPRSAAPVTTQA